MEIFNENNTYWDWDEDDEGHRRRELICTDDLDDLSEETGLPVSLIEKLFEEYRDASKDLTETEEQIHHDYITSQIGRF